jgi:hypothetical protein
MPNSNIEIRNNFKSQNKARNPSSKSSLFGTLGVLSFDIVSSFGSFDIAQDRFSCFEFACLFLGVPCAFAQDLRLRRDDSIASAFFIRQQKQSSQCPNAADGAGNCPYRFVPTAIVGDYPA